MKKIILLAVLVSIYSNLYSVEQLDIVRDRKYYTDNIKLAEKGDIIRTRRPIKYCDFSKQILGYGSLEISCVYIGHERQKRK